MNYQFSFDDGSWPGTIAITIENQEAALTFDPTGRRVLSLSPVHSLKFVRFDPPEGFWSEVRLISDAIAVEYVEFRRLPRNGPIGWWHRAHGIATPDVRLGSGMRIGVVDEALAPSASSSLSHVVNTGGEAWHPTNGVSTRAFQPFGDHSIAVCSLIGARCDSALGYVGVSPGANLYFSAAASESSERLNVRRMIDGLALLSEKYGCHVISVSAGNIPDLPGVLAAIRDARRHGSLCFFAAGNDSKCVYPAKYKKSISVGAVGAFNVAPLGTDVWMREEFESLKLDVCDLFLWSKSPATDIDFVAAGVGPVWNRDTEAARAVVGTSYAAPIAAAIAANILAVDPIFQSMSADQARVNYALTVLQKRSKQLFLEQGGQVVSRFGLITA